MEKPNERIVVAVVCTRCGSLHDETVVRQTVADVLLGERQMKCGACGFESANAHFVSVEEKLACEVDTPAMGDRVLAAACAALDIPQRDLQVDFEHGQWWVTKLSTGRQWSVNDAEGPGTTDGFDFEEVSHGED